MLSGRENQLDYAEDALVVMRGEGTAIFCVEEGMVKCGEGEV
jgi:hypothetical protein